MNIYISPTGSDTTGDGSRSNPYQHLSYLFKTSGILHSGDTVIMLDGTYYDNDYIQDWNGVEHLDGILVKSESEDYSKVKLYPTVLRQQYSYDCYVFYGRSITFQNLTIIYDKDQISNLENKQQLIFRMVGTCLISFKNCFIKFKNFSSFPYSCYIGGGDNSSHKGKFSFNRCTIIGVKNTHDSGILSQYVYSSILKYNIIDTFDLDVQDVSGIQTDFQNCLHNITTINLNDASDCTCDPQFVDINQDASLQPTSPCLDRGVTSSSSVSEFYIDPTNGNDSNAGTYSHPFKHIYRAIDLAEDGYTIYLLNGSYTEELPRTIPCSLTIKGYYGFQSKVSIIDSDDIYTHEGIWDISDFDLTLEFISFYFEAGGVLHANGAGKLLAKHCFFYCTFDSLDYYSGRNFFQRTGGTATDEFYNCTFRHNVYFIYMGTNGNLKISNNIFEGAIHSAIYASNILVENHNCFYNNNDDGVSLDSSDLQCDPYFLTSSTGILKSTSPCIDAGIIISGQIETYKGKAPDIGFYEYGEKLCTVNSGSSTYTRIKFKNTWIGEYAVASIKYVFHYSSEKFPHGIKFWTAEELGGGHLQIVVNAWIRKSSRLEIEKYLLDLPFALGTTPGNLYVGNTLIRDAIVQRIEPDRDYHKWNFFKIIFIAPLQE